MSQTNKYIFEGNVSTYHQIPFLGTPSRFGFVRGAWPTSMSSLVKSACFSIFKTLCFDSSNEFKPSFFQRDCHVNNKSYLQMKLIVFYKDNNYLLKIE